jgi:hypothetical protein
MKPNSISKRKERQPSFLSRLDGRHTTHDSLLLPSTSRVSPSPAHKIIRCFPRLHVPLSSRCVRKLLHAREKNASEDCQALLCWASTIRMTSHKAQTARAPLPMIGKPPVTIAAMAVGAYSV